MDSEKLKPVSPLPFVFLFLIITAGAILVGALYYQGQKKYLLNSGLQELSTITDMKVRQISQWRKERLGDGTYFSRNVSLIRQFSRFLQNPNDKTLQKDLKLGLQALTDTYDYINSIFLDRNLNVRLFYPGSDTIVGDYLKPKLPGILKNNEVVLTDLHRSGSLNFIHLDLIVPLRGPEPVDTSVIGLLVLRMDPAKVLFPLLQSWPVKSESSESFIFHREGDEIVYLSELKYIDSASLNIRKSITEEKLAAVMAIQGIQETTDAIDYRGEPVIASMKKVPESPWYMVAKTNKTEVLLRLRKQFNLVMVFIVLLMLSATSLLGLIRWRQRLTYYREKYETEKEKLALVKRYDYILKYANDLILLLDKDFLIVEANDKVFETYQYRRNEIIGRNVSLLISDEHLAKVMENKNKIDDQGFFTFEANHKKKDGTVFPVEISARKVDIEGVTHYQAIMRDITERKTAETILKESEEKFRKIFEESPIGIAMTGKDLGIIMANSEFCKMLGYPESELIGLTFRNFTHPDYISGDELSIMKLVAQKIPVYHTEKQYIRSDNLLVWGSTTISIIRNRSGEVQFFLAMVEDITKRKSAETELEKSFSLQKATLESTADGILVVDNAGKIVQFNQKFMEMWRIPREVMSPMLDEAALNFVLDQLKYPEEFFNKVKSLYTDPEAIVYDVLEFNDGRFFERYSQPQKIGGKTVGRAWSFRDITMRKKAEAEIIAAKEKAEESDRLKTAFLHNVSHEIRTPMNAILGFTTLLNEPDLKEEEKHQFTDIIFQSGNHLLSIINDIVDLASIESGQVKLKISKINLNLTLRNLSEQFSYKEKPNKISLSLNTPLSLEKAEIMTDATKLVQILSNLINNAFKFTPGEKSLSATN